jgi:hypothetical protein
MLRVEVPVGCKRPVDEKEIRVPTTHRIGDSRQQKAAAAARLRGGRDSARVN